MLNGLYPVIVLQKTNSIKINDADKTMKQSSKLSLKRSLKRSIEPLPVPVYLDENLTGIALMSQSIRVEFASDSIVVDESSELRFRDNDVGSSTLTKSKENTLKVKQRGITNGVDIVLKASRDSIGMNLLLPIADIAFQRAASLEYFISYFNRNVILFRSKLGHFSTDESVSDTSVTINISLIKEDKLEKEKKKEEKFAPQKEGDASKVW